MDIQPIGIFRCLERYPYDVPRQGVFSGDNRGVIQLERGHDFEQALTGLDTFSHIWVLFCFDQADGWRPMVRPPRHTESKMGVFATRSPHRPNGIGMSCVRLVKIDGLNIEICGHDLLDGTPVLDIKPYLPFADAFPDASPGWTGLEDRHFTVVFSQRAECQLSWLETNGVPCIRAFVMDRLGMEPCNPRRNRMVDGMLAYRTWRIAFDVSGEEVLVHEIHSGYSEEELALPEDKYGDKSVHRAFMQMAWND